MFLDEIAGCETTISATRPRPGFGPFLIFARCPGLLKEVVEVRTQPLLPFAPEVACFRDQAPPGNLVGVRRSAAGIQGRRFVGGRRRT